MSWHFCAFCGTNHSSMSCFHPGRVRLQELEAQLAAQAAQLETVRQEYETLKKELLSYSSSTTSTT